MSYLTYFEGKLKIDLQDPQLTNLRVILDEAFQNKQVINVTEDLLEVNDEWKDSGLMESIVLFIDQNGTLENGTIKCEGEDMKDKWNIVIVNGKPYLEEVGGFTTYNRTFSKLDKKTS